MYKYVHTCIYIHISCPHTYTHTHIYTHAYKMFIWTHAKHVWNEGAAATARAAQLDTKKLYPSPCPHHDSAPSRPHPLICTGAEPIHPVYCPRQLQAWPWPPETRSFFCHFGGVYRSCPRARCCAHSRTCSFSSLHCCHSVWCHNRVSLVMMGSSKIAYFWNLFCSISFKSQNRPTWPHSVAQTRNKFQKHEFQTRTVDCERTDFSPPNNCVDVCPRCMHEAPEKLSGCNPCEHHTPPWYQPFWPCRNHSWSGATVTDVGVPNVPPCVAHTRWKAVRGFWDLLECTRSTHVQSHYGWPLLHLSWQQDDQPHFFLSIGTVNLLE